LRQRVALIGFRALQRMQIFKFKILFSASGNLATIIASINSTYEIAIYELDFIGSQFYNCS